MKYDEMSVKQRAEYLLEKGVVGKIGVDRDTMLPGYAAYVNGMGQLPVGFHRSEQAAIDAGTTWLKKKATANGSDAR